MLLGPFLDSAEIELSGAVRPFTSLFCILIQDLGFTNF